MQPSRPDRPARSVPLPPPWPLTRSSGSGVAS
jgi:hypothetical protein